MKCLKCGGKMQHKKGLKFNSFKIDGWKCSCGEVYYDPEQAERILVLNKLKKEKIRAKLGRIKSNLFLRLPKDVEIAFGFKKGEDIEITVENNCLKLKSVVN